MNATSIKTPLVRTTDALEFAGTQANLARILGISRASVCAWYSEKREFVPELQAYKLISIRPELNISGIQENKNAA